MGFYDEIAYWGSEEALEKLRGITIARIRQLGIDQGQLLMVSTPYGYMPSSFYKKLAQKVLYGIDPAAVGGDKTSIRVITQQKESSYAVQKTT